MDEHGTALVADFQRYYGLRLAAVMPGVGSQGTLAPREVLSMVRHLPPGCAFHASVNDDPSMLGWSRGDTIAADLWDLLAMYAMRSSKKPPPKYPRPGQRKPAKKLDLLDVVPEAIKKRLLERRKEIGRGA